MPRSHSNGSVSRYPTAGSSKRLCGSTAFAFRRSVRIARRTRVGGAGVRNSSVRSLPSGARSCLHPGRPFAVLHGDGRVVWDGANGRPDRNPDMIQPGDVCQTSHADVLHDQTRAPAGLAWRHDAVVAAVAVLRCALQAQRPSGRRGEVFHLPPRALRAHHANTSSAIPTSALVH